MIPGDWSFEGMKILETSGWWMGIIGACLSEYGDPNFKFDEITLGMITTFNFMFGSWQYGLDFAIGMLLLRAPWSVLLWFVFDDPDVPGILPEPVEEEVIE